MIYIEEKSAKKCPGITSLFLNFKYNEQIVDAIRPIYPKNYDKKTYTWEIPITELSVLLSRLSLIDKIELKLLNHKEPEDFNKIKLNTNKYKFKPFDYQEEGIKYGLANNKWLLLDAPGLGKAFTLDTKIITPNGYKLIKDIHVGDLVFDEKGNVCNVTAEYNHSNLNMYDIKFSTGDTLTCCEDHLWQILYEKPVWDKNTKTYKRTHFNECQNTKWLLENSRFKKLNVRIPFCEPLKFKENNHIIHPYILGCLIGDGCLLASISFTTSDKYIMDKVESLLPPSIRCSYNLNDSGIFNCGLYKNDSNRENIFIKELKRLNLHKHNTYTKFIPKEYLYDSVENRLCLLQGLMDTDGTAGKKIKTKNPNCSQFSTSSEQLAEDFQFLIQSLGGYTTVRKYIPKYYNSKYGKTIISKNYHYNISIHMNNMQDLFSLPRKKNLVNPRKFKIRRRIVDIKYVGIKPGKCISVDSPSHLYLADKCIVTHNTSQLIHIAEELKKREGIKHCLVICGINTLKSNWSEEIKKHSNLDSIILGQRVNKKGKIVTEGIPYRIQQLKENIKEFFIITNVESLRNDKLLKELTKGKNSFDMIIVDEIHKCKSVSSAQGHNLLKLKAKYQIGATGTLLTNKPEDAYMPLKWIGAEKSSNSVFKNMYYEYGGAFGNEIIGLRNIEHLKYHINQFSLRRTEDLLNLPDKFIIEELVDMNDKQAEFYNNIKQGIVNEVDKVHMSTANLLAMITRLRQATALPSILTSENIESSKVERCISLCDEIISNGSKVVIFSTFKETANELFRQLQQYKPLLCTGDVSQDEIDISKDKFQNEDENKIIICTWQKMGTGLTLTRANYAIFIDTPFTAADFEQAYKRIHRIGSNKTVFIYNLIAKDTFDERVRDIITDKKIISDYVIDDKVESMSADRLKQLILS